MTTMPNDIYPESGCRLPLPERETLDDSGKKIYDQVIGPAIKTGADLRGPAGILLHSPRVAQYHVGQFHYLTFESGLSDQVRELAILVIARELDSRYEWAAHESLAFKAGVPEDIVELIKHRRSLDGLPETESIVIQLGREIVEKRKASSGTYAQALKIFGKKGLVDLVALMAHYAATAVILSAFDKQVRPDQPALPEV